MDLLNLRGIILRLLMEEKYQPEDPEDRNEKLVTFNELDTGLKKVGIDIGVEELGDALRDLEAITCIAFYNRDARLISNPDGKIELRSEGFHVIRDSKFIKRFL